MATMLFFAPIGGLRYAVPGDPSRKPRTQRIGPIPRGYGVLFGKICIGIEVLSPPEREGPSSSLAHPGRRKVDCDFTPRVNRVFRHFDQQRLP
jgi:hypothetical protein